MSRRRSGIRAPSEQGRSALKKYRYEFPPLEAHYVEAPNAQAIVKYVKRTYPHNYDEVMPTLVEIPRWPAFWTTVDDDGRALPGSK